MPSRGRPWDRTRGIHKTQARNTNEPCWICKKPIDWSAEPRTPWAYSADHVTPTSLGGTDALSNLRTAHYSCNSSRGNTARGDFPTSRRW
jgi:5-methylcytosine-specific restriction endonuclease McrA